MITSLWREAPRPATRLLLASLVGFGLLPLGGCSFSKPNLAKQQYLIEARRHAHAAPPRTPATVKIRPFRVAIAFDQRSFVYRWGEAQYESDFYHQFFAAPGNMLSDQTRNWLLDAGIFETVLPATSELMSAYRLEGNVTRLYGDFRDPKSPQAVLAIEFLLIQNSAAKSPVRFQRNYRQETLLKELTPPALVQGWSASLEQIFKALEKDLLTLSWWSEGE